MDFFSSALVKRYHDILKATPSSTAFCPLAQIYRLRKDLDFAEKLCLHGLRHNPNHWGGHIALAQVYRDRGNWKEALKYLYKAKNIDPDNPRVYEILGEIYRDRNDTKNSLAAFKMVLFLKPWSQFAEQMVQQLENTSPLKKPQNNGLLSIKKRQTDSLSQISKQRKIKKLRKLLVHIEGIIANSTANSLG